MTLFGRPAGFLEGGTKLASLFPAFWEPWPLPLPLPVPWPLGLFPLKPGPGVEDSGVAALDMMADRAILECCAMPAWLQGTPGIQRKGLGLGG